MARFLSDLLDAEEPTFTKAMYDLEQTSGRAGADVKLIGDITAKAHESMRALGLSPASSTGEEVYRALLARIEKDNTRLVDVLGADAARAEEARYITPFLIDAASKVKFNKRVFVLKREKAKDLLRQMPPARLMRHLGYSDIEKMFEGEDFDELYTALRFSEGAEWLEKYNELFSQVSANDYEERDMRIIQLHHRKYVRLAAQYVQKRGHNVTHTKELGTLAIVPVQARKVKGLPIRALSTLLHYMNEIKLYSTFFKVKSVQPNFGSLVVETLVSDPGTGSQLAGKRVHWRVIQRHLGKNRNDSSTSAFEPHVQSEDLHSRRAEELLFQIDPELTFWEDRDYVALNYDGFPVSFNLFDVSAAYSNSERYENRYAHHFRGSLWNEIFVRYMGFKNLSDQVMSQLDSDKVILHTAPAPSQKQKKSKIRKDKTNKNLIIRERLIAAAEGRLQTVVDEFEQVFEILARYEKTVTIFGSARKLRDDVPAGAYDLAARLSREGYAVVTGGGHGIMEAANRGAYEAGGASIGFNILLPFEQTLNEYTTENFEFAHFFGRKVSMTLDSSAFIYFPGGFGTFDELFEILALVQTRKIEPVPVILVGSDFWRPWDAAIREVMLDRYQTIGYEDTELYRIYDSYDEIVQYINEEHRKSSQ